ncbi:MAG: stage III sporulation protein AF [Firmicutes bacterium]|nr:stage III sporulation protein AF [Bacillota bacterium]
MDVLRQLIQTIVVLVILAVFIEMLLPLGDMRRYVKMVLGLLIIVAVLQTVAGVLGSGLAGKIPAVTESFALRNTPPLEDIMAAGQSIAAANRREAAQYYTQGIERQVLSLAELNNDLHAVKASVTLRENSDEINGITIFCSVKSIQPQAPADIQPIIIGTTGEATGKSGAKPSAAEVRAAADLANVVANFYNLRAEQVQIKFQ